MGTYSLPSDGNSNWGGTIRGVLDSLDARALSEAFASDSFGRADGAPGVTDTGQTWVVPTGTAAISSGKMVLTGTTTAVFPVGTSEVDITCDVIHTGGAPGIAFRSDTAGNDRLNIQLDSVNGFRYQKTDTGTGTLLEQVPMSFTTDGSRTYRVRAVAVGDMVRCYLDGELLINRQLTSAEQTKFSALTAVGFRCTTSGGTFNDIRVVDPTGGEDVSPLRAVSGAYTLVRSDVGKMLEQTSASSSVITVPQQVFPAGSAVYIVQIGAGTCTVSAGSGMTVQNAGAIGGQYFGRTLYFRSLTEAVLL